MTKRALVIRGSHPPPQAPKGWIKIYDDGDCRRFYKITKRVGDVIFYDFGEIARDSNTDEYLPLRIVGSGNRNLNEGIHVVPYTKEMKAREQYLLERNLGIFNYGLPGNLRGSLPSSVFYKSNRH